MKRLWVLGTCLLLSGCGGTDQLAAPAPPPQTAIRPEQPVAPPAAPARPPSGVPGRGLGEPPCRDEQLALSLTWRATSSGLDGEVTARNMGERACDLTRKPQLFPLGRDGKPLPVESIMSLELRTKPTIVPAGATAVAPVSWASWCGAETSGRVLIDKARPIMASGPAQPPCRRGPLAAQNLSSGWYEPR